MIRLLLVRHGLTVWNQERRYIGSDDIPLNEIGKHQAAALANRLKEENVDAIYSSDLKRSLETASIIGESWKIQPKIDPRLREMSFGVFEGLTFQEAQERYPDMLSKWLADSNQTPDEGESFTAFSHRISSFLSEISSSNNPESVLIVAHGGTLREILRLLLGLPPDGHWYFRIDPASLSEVHLYDGHPSIIQLNSTCHLNEA